MKTIYCIRVIDFDTIRVIYEFGSALDLKSKYDKLGYFVLDISPIIVKGVF